MEPLLLAPIPDDVVVKHVVPLLEAGHARPAHGVREDAARASAPSARRKARPRGRSSTRRTAWRCRPTRTFWTVPSGCSGGRGTSRSRTSSAFDLAKAFACGTDLQGCKDEAFPRPRPRMRSIVSALAESATWLVCRKTFGPRYFDDDEGDIVFKDLRVGEAVDLKRFRFGRGRARSAFESAPQ